MNELQFCVECGETLVEHLDSRYWIERADRSKDFAHVERTQMIGPFCLDCYDEQPEVRNLEEA